MAKRKVHEKRTVYSGRVSKGKKELDILLTPKELERAYRRSQEDYKVRKKTGWTRGKYRLG